MKLRPINKLTITVGREVLMVINVGATEDIVITMANITNMDTDAATICDTTAMGNATGMVNIVADIMAKAITIKVAKSMTQKQWLACSLWLMSTPHLNIIILYN